MNQIIYLLLLLFVAPVFSADVIKLTENEIANIGIEVSKLKSVSQSLTKRLPAKVTIPNKSQRVISIPQDGVVEIMLVAEGDNIIAGQALAQINSPQIVKSQNDYLQSLSRMEQSKQEMQRDKSLFDEGIIAERRYHQSLSSYQQDKTEVAMYRKGLEMAGMNAEAIAKLDKNRVLNSHLTVTSPLAGVVMKQFATAGQRLTAADPLYQIAQLSPLWLEIHVPLDVAQTVSINDQIVICDKAIEGQVIALGREVHAADQGVLVRAEINQKTEQLIPGEFVEACFIQHSTEAQFELARSAIFRHEGETIVFVQSTDGFQPLIVELVKESGDIVIVRGNLSEEQYVVTTGTATLKAAWLGMGGE